MGTDPSCRQCGAVLEPAAIACPSCGNIRLTSPWAGWGRIALGIVLGLLVGLLLGGIAMVPVGLAFLNGGRDMSGFPNPRGPFGLLGVLLDVAILAASAFGFSKGIATAARGKPALAAFVMSAAVAFLLPPTGCTIAVFSH